MVIIPKSTHIERMEENFNILDFELTAEDMKTIASLDKKQSYAEIKAKTCIEWREPP
ncbi:MAG: hypothetical protein ACI4QN_03505 [Candidatus Coproplasma sp.]